MILLGLAPLKIYLGIKTEFIRRIVVLWLQKGR